MTSVTQLRKYFPTDTDVTVQDLLREPFIAPSEKTQTSLPVQEVSELPRVWTLPKYFGIEICITLGNCKNEYPFVEESEIRVLAVCSILCL
jgi:hypothetical protein